MSRTIYATAVELLETLFDELGGIDRNPVRLVGVRAEQLVPSGSGDGLLWDSDEDWREIERVEDAVAEKFGRGALKPASLVVSPTDAPIGESAHGATKAVRE